MHRVLGAVIVATTLLAGRSPAQKPDEPPAYERAMNTWLTSDHADRALLDRAVKAVLDAGTPGYRALAKVMHDTPATDRERRIGVDSLLSNVILGVLEQAKKSDLIYAGQFDDLRVLQPEAGRFLASLVIDTPPWFPEDERAAVVPALRDVYPDGPSSAVINAMAEIARDDRFEAEELRIAVSYALAQWGRREFVESHIHELEQNAGEGKTSDELWFVRELAGVYYRLRDYAHAADLWQKYLDGTRALGSRPSALDLYNAACNLSRAGRVEPALGAVEGCCQRIADHDLDTSQKFSRKMFETDPDLRAIRVRPRFAAAVDKTFPPDEDGEKQKEPPDGR